MSLENISSNKLFGGWHKQYTHESQTLNCNMRFAIYLPPESQSQTVPVLYWLSGLTCTDENFMQKSGAQRVASELGIAIVAPDTSPRGDDVPDDPDAAYDFGLGAGFYVNATRQPWRQYYQMYDYVVSELPELIEQHFPVNDKRSIAGHSMGGHGALVIALRNPDRYSSVSAFSPICNPVNAPWGQKAFMGYLGNDREQWKHYDACELLKRSPVVVPTLVDQGSRDTFLHEQLRLDVLKKAVADTGYPMTIRMQEGYDHSYHFIATFIEDHLRFHSQKFL
ncbi:S-formylglutathione hydrolase [Endozoicomonas sp. GU-1]|uniref:S-formylglutathione hydrolase n=1 Tax=Endozoicomonas sp. GU-1 TaxID=3009078 RepID=UPI0022B4B2CA|nr:S-formylglutathione hydrolase [Endozoicomonas sp. GU-1]WBA83713.1 S-formylglutathione hydrolase [Endozoicomonas sp. GU-1]WBA86695.1 S-formylglutathione hydrolase [Endozoicomonas sp. GU-1]